jgi:hypothetical protein
MSFHGIMELLATIGAINGRGIYVIDENNEDYHPLNQNVDTDLIAPTPTPSTSIEGWIPRLTIPIIAVLILAIIIISLVLFRRYQKTISQNKPTVREKSVN